jgi:alkanesulfonate monooxygenase SsuD/methylene tetrahydromethanopterin reductase-like flavin-dependent oxidoreductase (luciferase family)
MEPMLKMLGRGAEQFLQRTVYGTAEDVIGRVSEYVGHGLDKFVLWPIATPDAWAKQVQLVGSEIANHYMKAAA